MNKNKLCKDGTQFAPIQNNADFETRKKIQLLFIIFLQLLSHSSYIKL